MSRSTNPLKKNSQILRKEMTKEERHLWYDFLKGLNITIKRQKIVGNYILDFYCASKKVAIELDGSQHYSKEGKESDSERDKYLQEKGIMVLRYSNYEINMHWDAVCEDIARHLGIIE
ncbi:endonuclease domain-containing protein [Butyrivibrio sp. AE3004]|uniref:endonuclease domain-containing protein n=1 Tax=Butyrivibrio sp. AE3004 TaxID=1506994 RepID=UPI00056A96DE|nr:endonuclease domain-containing protein [Butyrivibrio sp. AE3004]